MAIIRFDPFLSRNWLRPFAAWDEEEDFPTLTMTEGLNVYEENGKVIVEASVPGVLENKLDITYEDGVLHISGRHEEKEEEKKKNRVVHKMQRISSFDYTTYLPRPIDEKSLEAEVKNGVVRISAQIAEKAKARKIPIKTGK